MSEIPTTTVEQEREMLKAGVCPRTGSSLYYGEEVRPVCQWCDCGEDPYDDDLWDEL